MAKRSWFYHDLILIWIIFGINVLNAGPLKEYQYFRGKIKVLDIDGNPVSNTFIYGYSKKYHLLWPRVDDQHSEAWSESDFQKTNFNGQIQVELPKARWTFFACGLTESEKIICVSKEIYIQEDFTLEMSPEESLKTRFVLNRKSGIGKQSCLHDCIFLKPKDLPLYIPLKSEFKETTTFQTNKDSQVDAWGQGRISADNTDFVFNWGQLKEGQMTPKSANEMIIAGTPDSAVIHWTKQWIYLLQGQIPIESGQKILFSNGNFSIGYKRKIHNLVYEFVPRKYRFNSGLTYGLLFEDDLTVGVWTQNTSDGGLGWLLMTDENEHLVRSIKESGRDYAFAIDLRRNNKRVIQNSPGSIEFHMKGQKFSTRDEFRFSINHPVFRQSHKAGPECAIYSRHYWTRLPDTLMSLMSNRLEEIDALDDKMRRVSGKSKVTSERTELRLMIDDPVSEIFDGNNVKLKASRLFLKDSPIADYTMAHELAHTFGTRHGGLQEMMIEVTRSWSDDIIFGQKHKWIFMDRMNDREYKLEEYPQGSLYLFSYALGGKEFLRFVSANMSKLRKAGYKENMTDNEIDAGILSLWFGLECYPVISKYGLCSTPNQLSKVYTYFNGVAVHPDLIDMFKVSYQNNPDYHELGMVSGKLKEKRNWFVLEKDAQIKIAPPLRVSSDIKFDFILFPGRGNADVILDISLGNHNYVLNITDKQSAPLNEQNAIRCSAGKTKSLMVQIKEDQILFRLDGKIVHRLPRKEHVSCLDIMISNMGSMEFGMTKFKIQQRSIEVHE